MTIAVIVAITMLLILLLLILFSQQKPRPPAEFSVGDLPSTPCPLCTSPITKYQKIHSLYYRKKTPNHHLPVEEITTHIFGCPFCWPTNVSHPRNCPVCQKPLSPDGYLVARTFRKRGKKDHVHIIGCTECKRVR